MTTRPLVVKVLPDAELRVRSSSQSVLTVRCKAPSMVFSSQNLPEVPSDGKDHEAKVRLLQHKVMQAIREGF